MKCIAVVDKNFGIGRNNKLLFHLPADLKNFKEKTLGKIVVMGANTFASLPNGALPNRTNIVLDHTNTPHENALTVNSLDSLKTLLKNYPTQDIFVIGGASVYSLLLDFCDTAYLTHVDADGNADTFFPNLNQNPNWQKVEQSPAVIDNNFKTTYCKYINKNCID